MVYKLVREGRLEAVRVGRLVRIYHGVCRCEGGCSQGFLLSVCEGKGA
ncbi:hypothetical protein GMI69_01215 [Eggerthellaceae bacterium zg-887]|nr:hypothetical protein [Xiamenia xianingshaonis]